MGWSASRVEYARVLDLIDALEIPEALAWTLVRRGLDSPRLAREFIASDGPLDPPEALPGTAAIADRLAQAIARGERIAVHGDYDCDGVCATAALARPLRAAGADVETFLPSRFTDGYGVQPSTVERLADAGIAVLVCVDCGTSAVGALERAVELGIDPLICDHHLAGGVRAPGIIANPALGQPRDDAPAATGVVSGVVRALAERLGAGLVGPDPEADADLVALATVADAVPLVGQNRRLVTRGLAAIRRDARPGIRALCALGGVDPRMIDARALAFAIAPVINAAGRLEHPDDALALLLEEDPERARGLAQRLWALNASRRDVEQRITAEAIAQIEASPPEVRDALVILAVGDGWHEGVVGIVASRLVDHFDRPAVVLARSGDVAKGSGRSLPGLDLHDLLGHASGRLTRWGGHAGAVGLQLAATDIAAFRDELSRAAARLAPALEQARVRRIDAVVGARDLTIATAEAFDALAPFGRGNPEPRLLMPGCCAEGAATMGKGGRHLNVRLQCGGAHLRAVGFGKGHLARGVADGDRVDAIVALGIERYQGFVGPRVTIDRLEHVNRGPAGYATCAPACGLGCPERITVDDIRARVLGTRVTPPDPPRPVDGPRTVRDHRGEGSGLVWIAALAGADGGVVVVVSDIPRRRAMLDDLLHPARLGLEAAVLGGVRCAPGPVRARLARAGRRPSVSVVDYAALPDAVLPSDAHLVVLDPPSSPHDAAWLRAHGADRFVHLLWTDHEIAFAQFIATERYELRPAAREIWRALSAAPKWGWNHETAGVLMGTGPSVRDPRAVADILVGFSELELIDCAPDGITVNTPAPGRRLEQAPRMVAAAEALRRTHAYLARAHLLDVFGPAYADAIEAPV